MIEILSIYSDDQKIAMVTCIMVAIALLLINTQIGPTIAADTEDQPDHSTPAQPAFDIDPAAFWRKD